MSSGAVTELMNDREFLDDLQNLVNEPPHAPNPNAARNPMDAFDALSGGDNAAGRPNRPDAAPGRVAAMWPDEVVEQAHRASRGEFDEPPDADEADAPAEARPSRAVTALIVLVCAATGAGMAALVFHDRAAQLLALLTP
jgi:hypothetical protein